jgi:hypothetical protein
MRGGDKTANETLAEFQRRTREALRAHQEAYLAAVKAWRDGAGKGPQPTWPPAKMDNLTPKPDEVAEAYYAFASKLLADQSRFLEELSKTMAGTEKKSS